jgi:hypothetical protein
MVKHVFGEHLPSQNRENSQFFWWKLVSTIKKNLGVKGVFDEEKVQIESQKQL